MGQLGNAYLMWEQAKVVAGFMGQEAEPDKAELVEAHHAARLIHHSFKTDWVFDRQSSST